MSRKRSPCSVPVEIAAEILGMDVQTLRLCMRRGYYKDIGEALKTNEDKECFTYEISKFKLFQRQGLDVRLSVEEAIDLIRKGKPPFIEQVPVELMDLWWELKYKRGYFDNKGKYPEENVIISK